MFIFPSSYPIHQEALCSNIPQIHLPLSISTTSTSTKANIFFLLKLLQQPDKCSLTHVSYWPLFSSTVFQAHCCLYPQTFQTPTHSTGLCLECSCLRSSRDWFLHAFQIPVYMSHHQRKFLLPFNIKATVMLYNFIALIVKITLITILLCAFTTSRSIP